MEKGKEIKIRENYAKNRKTAKHRIKTLLLSDEYLSTEHKFFGIRLKHSKLEIQISKY
ncbi:MAG: hypothetical protein QME42_02905 [bacterium]|nr:hypothetical protein [bacterium]